VNVISVPYNALIIAHEKMSAFAYISIIDGFLKLGIAFCIQWLTFDKLLLYTVLYSIVAIIIRFIYSAYCTRKFVEAKCVSFQIDKSLFKEMFGFSSWNFIGVGSLILRNQGIDILLNMFFGVSVNAAKGISNQVQGAVQQFVGNFTSAVNPQ
jgi:O-antigen/teichoic acid export membrane protein